MNLHSVKSNLEWICNLSCDFSNIYFFRKTGFYFSAWVAGFLSVYFTFLLVVFFLAFLFFKKVREGATIAVLGFFLLPKLHSLKTKRKIMFPHQIYWSGKTGKTNFLPVKIEFLFKIKLKSIFSIITLNDNCLKKKKTTIIFLVWYKP